MIYRAAAGSGAAIAHPFPLSAGSNNFYGFKHGDYLRTNVDVPTVKFDHDFDSGIALRNLTRYGHYLREFRITEAQIYTPGTSTLQLVNPNTPLSALTITRNQLYGTGVETDLTNQTDATIHLQTGSVAHTVVTGIELGRETSLARSQHDHRAVQHHVTADAELQPDL